MRQLLFCGLIYILLLIIFYIWGRAVSGILKLNNAGLPMRILVGFCAFFIVMEIAILPISLSGHSLLIAATAVCLLTILGTIAGILYAKEDGGTSERIGLKALPDPVTVIAIALTLAAMAYAVFYRYMGWDQTNYIGLVELFVKSGELWTKDAMNGGIAATEVDFHYAMSAFYPLCAILCKVFRVEARLLMLYTIRALCVTLTALTVYCWGSMLIPDKKQAGSLFVCVYTILSIFATATHGASYMSLIRGYEAKGYCAAVVMPLLALILIRLIMTPADKADWRMLTLIAWASIPISPSSLGLVPAAVAIAGLAIMIGEKRVQPYLKNIIIAILPNLIFMAAYVVVKDMI